MILATSRKFTDGYIKFPFDSKQTQSFSGLDKDLVEIPKLSYRVLNLCATYPAINISAFSSILS